MAIINNRLGGTDATDGDILYADDLNNTYNASQGALGEVRMFALSMTGAVTKSALQALGWAICDGTTPASQSISTPTITTTPDLQDKFLSMSNDETSGTTGGQSTFAIDFTAGFSTAGSGNACVGIDGQTIDGTVDNKPPFYEVAYFMKVR